MSEMARDVGLGSSNGLAGLKPRGRARALPGWMRLLVLLAVATALWIPIVYAIRALFRG